MVDEIKSKILYSRSLNLLAVIVIVATAESPDKLVQMMLGSPAIGFSKVSVLYLHFPAGTSATFALDLSSIFIEILKLSEIFFIGWIYSYRRKEGPERLRKKHSELRLGEPRI
jgi:hypothetical protein